MSGRHVNKGDPLRLRAKDWNATLDLVRRARAGQLSQSAEPAVEPGSQTAALIRNDSGADVARFGVLGIVGPLIDPADDADEFARAVMLTGTTPADPDHRGRIAIALEPIADGELGRAVIAGTVQCRVNVQAEGDTFAEIADADATQLASGAAGSARILWVAGGTGTRWAIVALSADAQARALAVFFGPRAGLLGVAVEVVVARRLGVGVPADRGRGLQPGRVARLGERRVAELVRAPRGHLGAFGRSLHRLVVAVDRLPPPDRPLVLLVAELGEPAWARSGARCGGVGLARSRGRARTALPAWIAESGEPHPCGG